ncbi:MAG: hypothetical protein EAX96_04670 [Candidatus Lokiarchaeota archaeon]|nr:hypothetical protein [Candidatus Lokiarchaeota archaeon]
MKIFRSNIVYCPNCERLNYFDPLNNPKFCKNCNNQNILVNYGGIYDLSDQKNQDLIAEQQSMSKENIFRRLVITSVGIFVSMGIFFGIFAIEFISLNPIISIILWILCFLFIPFAIYSAYYTYRIYFRDERFISDKRRLEVIQGLCYNLIPKDILKLPLIEKVAEIEGIKIPNSVLGMRYIKLSDFLPDNKIICPNCQYELSIIAMNCSNCGEEIKKW